MKTLTSERITRGRGDSVLAEYEETTGAPSPPRWVKSYVYLGARLLATIAPNGASERVDYQHPDRLGTRLVTNNQDTSSSEQVSLPFGTALDAESTGSTKRRFTSYDRSNVTGLDYAVNRHYDPLQGRFSQVDPIGMASTSLGNPQTLNLYAYCANDPINHMDPNGLGFFSWLGGIFKKVVAAFVAAVVAVVVVLITGGNVHAALKAGRDVFRAAFQVYPGWQPSGGWVRTPPTFGSGPTLRQILGQTDLGRRLTPNRSSFLTPGINPQATLLGCNEKLAGIFGGEGAVAAATGVEPTGMANYGGLVRDHLLGRMHLYGSNDGRSITDIFIPGGFMYLGWYNQEQDSHMFYYAALGNEKNVTLIVSHLDKFVGLPKNVLVDQRTGIGRIGGKGGNESLYKPDAPYIHAHLAILKGKGPGGKLIPFSGVFCK